MKVEDAKVQKSKKMKEEDANVQKKVKTESGRWGPYLERKESESGWLKNKDNMINRQYKRVKKVE